MLCRTLHTHVEMSNMAAPSPIVLHAQHACGISSFSVMATLYALDSCSLNLLKGENLVLVVTRSGGSKCLLPEL